MKTLPLATLLLALGLPSSAPAQTRSLALDSATGLSLHNAIATAVTFNGKAALQLTAPAPAPAPVPAAPPPGATKKAGKSKGSGPAASEAARSDFLAMVDGLEFTNGTIEVDLAGEPGPSASVGARGFVGVAFRVQPDRATYDCFYLRPTNGRSDDQERRNRSAQHVSHPVHTWFKLREETPSRYESYVDIGPAEWIHVKIDVEGQKARLFVNRAAQPVLVVNDVKTGADGRGAVALWFEGSTIARFANLKIEPR
jgi:hypothetical protein